MDIYTCEVHSVKVEVKVFENSDSRGLQDSEIQTIIADSSMFKGRVVKIEIKQSPLASIKEQSPYNTPYYSTPIQSFISAYFNPSILRNLSGLKALVVPNNINEKGLSLFQNLKNVTTANLSMCLTLPDAGFIYLNTFTALTHLNLSFCSQLTGEGLGKLSDLKLLEILNISHVPHITDEKLSCLPQFQNLKHLNLASDYQLTDAIFTYIGKLPKLEFVNLSYCSRLRGDDFHELYTLTNLRTLNLSHCHGMPAFKQPTRGSLSKLKNMNSALLSESELKLVALQTYLPELTIID